MDFDRANEKFGQEPDIEGLVPSLKELSLEDLKEIPFSVLNELLKTHFPNNANDESHKLLYDAIQRTAITTHMQTPLELVLKSDGLWVRVCSEEKASLYKEAIKLTEEFHLTEDRITHSLCSECEQKIRAKFTLQRRENITREIETIKRSALNIITPAHEIPAIAIEEETI